MTVYLDSDITVAGYLVSNIWLNEIIAALNRKIRTNDENTERNARSWLVLRSESYVHKERKQIS